MKLLKNLIMLSLMLLILSACSSRGFDRGALRQSLRGETKVITEKSIKEAYALKPQLKFPFKLGVYFDSCSKCSIYSRQNHNNSFTGKNKDRLLSIKADLALSNIIADMFIIPDAFISEQTPEAIRLAGAKQGADAVLHIKGDYALNQYMNPSGILYLTLIGMYIIPGTHIDALYMTSGIMYDVSNGYVYTVLESDGEGSTYGSLALIEDSDAITRARNNSVELFSEEFAHRLNNLHGDNEE